MNKTIRLFISGLIFTLTVAFLSHFTISLILNVISTNESLRIFVNSKILIISALAALFLYSVKWMRSYGLFDFNFILHFPIAYKKKKKPKKKSIKKWYEQYKQYFLEKIIPLLLDVDYEAPNTINIILSYLLIIFGTLCIVLAFPALLIFWFLEPTQYKRAIQLVVFLISVGSSVIYYLSNYEKLPTLADKVTFFSGCCFGPVAAVQLFL